MVETIVELDKQIEVAVISTKYVYMTQSVHLGFPNFLINFLFFYLFSNPKAQSIIDDLKSYKTAASILFKDQPEFRIYDV